MKNQVSEKIIEDILSSNKMILADILKVKQNELSLVARQKALNSGRLDLLYLHNDELLLIEIKIVNFSKDIIEQINNYNDDLISLQNENKLIKGKIRKIILVNGSSSTDEALCRKDNIELFNYDPRNILLQYYENFRELSQFLTIKSGDYGVVRLGLLNETLSLLSEGKSVDDLCKTQSRSLKTISNRLSIAILLDLVFKHDQKYYLSERGNHFVEIRDSNTEDSLSLEQSDFLASFIIETPFSSSITFTIMSLVESVFVLSKSIYPVPLETLIEYFVTSVGKNSTWQKPKARNTATYIFSNYACELGFLTKFGNAFFLTPKGIQSVLILQLNRSIRLIKSQQQ